MKTHLNKVFAAGVCMLLFNVNVFSQNSDILNQITNTNDYSTIELVRMDPRLSTFAHLVSLAGMNEQFENVGPHTLFVPTNKAFENMEIKDYLKLTNPDSKAKLIQFINYYYLPKKVLKYEFKDNDIIENELNEGIPVSVNWEANGNSISIGGANIIKADIQASDGIVDILDAVFAPSLDGLRIED